MDDDDRRERTDVLKACGQYLGPVSATPQVIVQELLEFAGVSCSDVVYDVGCGDGRVCVAAALQFGAARCCGIEIDPAAAARAKAAAEAASLPPGRVDIVCGNAFDESLAPATVVFLYLLPTGNRSIEEKLRSELRAGARVVTYMFRMPPAWDALLHETRVIGSCRPGGVDTSAFTKLFLYRMLGGGGEARGGGGDVPLAAAGGL